MTGHGSDKTAYEMETDNIRNKFNKGSELDKQTYKEGESTWGCKSGVLDVEDVKDFVKACIDEFYGDKFEDEIRTPIEARDILIRKFGESFHK